MKQSIFISNFITTKITVCRKHFILFWASQIRKSVLNIITEGHEWQQQVASSCSVVCLIYLIVFSQLQKLYSIKWEDDYECW